MASHDKKIIRNSLSSFYGHKMPKELINIIIDYTVCSEYIKELKDLFNLKIWNNIAIFKPKIYKDEYINFYFLRLFAFGEYKPKINTFNNWECPKEATDPLTSIIMNFNCTDSKYQSDCILIEKRVSENFRCDQFLHHDKYNPYNGFLTTKINAAYNILEENIRKIKKYNAFKIFSLYKFLSLFTDKEQLLFHKQCLMGRDLIGNAYIHYQNRMRMIDIGLL